MGHNSRLIEINPPATTLAAMSQKPAADQPRPNVYRLEALALREILADDSTDPEEVAHREWLKRRLAQEVRKVASIPTKLDTRQPRRRS